MVCDLLSAPLGTVERVRLHITPLNSELLDKIIGPSLRPLASNISFHTVQTFPERGFGYVELPAMEAQKLKKKLNGSTLKGSKVRIEEAKPEKKRKGEDEDDARDSKARKTSKKDKQKREDGVLAGYELEEGRRVKRGWSDAADADGKSTKKTKRNESKEADNVSEGRKLRFKTTIPPSKTPLDGHSKDKKKQTKDKDRSSGKKRVIVQEFTKTKPSAIASIESVNTRPGAVSYEDGKGWVDESGEIVEAEKPSKRSKRRQVTDSPASNDSSGHDGEAVQNSTQTDDRNGHEAMSIDEPSPESNTPVEASPSTSAVDNTSQSEKEVHPLEALFKRPASRTTNTARPRPKAIDTSFSFFDSSAAADGEDAESGMPPQTPHTRRDLEWRSQRSAAPTPDTAALGRKFSFPFAAGNESEDADEEADAEQDAEMRNAGQAEEGASQDEAQDRGEESAFRKWFYEHRGEFNRGWKKRRRDERKQSRQRENRRLSSKVV